MNDEERLIVSLEARVRDFERKMERAERKATQNYRGMTRGSKSATRNMERDMVRSTNSINRALSSTTSKIGMMGKAFAAGAIATGLAAIITGAGRAIRSMADLGDAAKRAGLGVEAFQEWRFVAEQNRIGIDALTDGFKELSLRADEFIVTGAGPAEEAFKRLGFGATDLRRRLEDPSELMLELIDRMEDLDAAAQIRVADEIFGGTAGERFVELLGQGRAGIEASIEKAREMGVVLEEDVITRATELDRRFSELQMKTETMFKGMVIGAADFAAEVLNLRQDLDDLFRSYDQARGLLGDGIANELENDSAAVAEHADELAQLRRMYENTADAAVALVPILQNAGFLMQSLGYDEKAREIFEVAEGMREVSGEMQDGTIEAEEFEKRMATLSLTARDALDELKAVGETSFEPAIGGVAGLIQVLGNAIIKARELRAELPGASPEPGGEGGEDAPAADAPVAPPARPKSRPDDIDFGYNPPAPVRTGGGGGGARPSGGGGSRKPRLSEYAQLVEDTREEIAKLNAEAASLVLVAEGGQDVGDALEYARKRAELLYEAQQAGKAITPSLKAEIDNLALSYTQAGQAAEEAAEKLRLIEQNAERGAERLTDLFMGILDGSNSAKEALAGLIKEFARMQMQKGLLSLANGGGWMGSLIQSVGGGLAAPSYAGGGFTGTGSRSGGIDGQGGFPAILHPNETVIDHAKGQAQSSGTTNVTVDLRGTTGDQALDQKLQGMAKQIFQEAERRAPGWVADHNRRIG